MSNLFEEIITEPKIIKAIKEIGFEQMTPIQEAAIPVLMQGRDIIGKAQTGTGKTAAFGIPAIKMIDKEVKGTQCLILCPTRELAIQAAEELRKFAKYLHGIKVLPIYGGQDISMQIRSLKGGVAIVVGTPGRVMDHMRRHTLKLDNIKLVVLDEADEMLNMGFRDDIETILEDIPANHQTALFSATMPQAIMEITNKYQKDSVLVQIAKKELTVPLVKQYYYEVKRQNKEEVTARLLDYYNPKQTLIFCNTKRMVDELAEKLKGRGYFAEALHGDMSQHQRDRVMKNFRAGITKILIATDVAARGIDVDDVEAVFNYDVPQDIEYYVHRIGRTGRAGRKGRSFTFVVGKEIYKVRDIERTCNTKIKARTIPSAADITAVKAQKIFTEVLDIMRENDLEPMISLINQKLNDEDCTAIELAAAFLKQQMGDEIEDIPVESYREERRKNKEGRPYVRRQSQGNVSKSRKNDSKKNDSKKNDSYRNRPVKNTSKTNKDFQEKKTYSKESSKGRKTHLK